MRRNLANRCILSRHFRSYRLEGVLRESAPRNGPGPLR